MAEARGETLERSSQGASGLVSPSTTSSVGIMAEVSLVRGEERSRRASNHHLPYREMS